MKLRFLALTPSARHILSGLAVGSACLLASATASAGVRVTGTNTSPSHIQATGTTAGSAPAILSQTNLTSAATVSSKVPPSHSEEDIRDIRQPRHIPHSWLWTAVAAGVLFLTASFAAWRWLRRGKSRALQPYEAALEQLAAARRLASAGQDREYGYAVSRIIRHYLEEVFHMRAPRLTTGEFLHELIEDRTTIPQSQRLVLAEFLQYCDFAKFADWRFSSSGLEAMHASAERFVRQTAALPAMAGEPVGSPQGRPAFNKSLEPALPRNV